jgi:hypothetical protein
MMNINSEKDMQESFRMFEQEGGKGITTESLREAFAAAEVEIL